MGTRGSRHNKGRKPLYKEHRFIASELLKQESAFPGVYFMKHTHWRDDDVAKLSVLCEAEADINRVGEILHRPPKTIVKQAQELGLSTPVEWGRLIRPKYQPRLRQQKVMLAYPYITRPRDEHADILAINNIVPKVFPDAMRADICQDIALAVLEGRVSLEDLKAKKPTWFINNFWKSNYEQAGRAVSFDYADDDRAYDEIASSVSAREWRDGEMNDKRRYHDAIFRTYQEPTQFMDAYRMQIGRIQKQSHERGENLSAEDIEEMVA